MMRVLVIDDEPQLVRTLQINPQGPRVRRGPVGAAHPTEWHLLEILVRHEGHLVSRRQLLREVWGPSYENSTNYLRQYVTQLRHKLEPLPARPQHLLTEQGVGYRLVADPVS